MFLKYIENGSNPYDEGQIGFSKRRKNSVISNVVGAAAFHGNMGILEHLLSTKYANGYVDVNFKAKEK